MPKYKNKGQKKPYNASQSRIQNAKEKVSTLNANKGSTTQVTEVLKCSQCDDGDSGVVQCECCTLWYCSKCCGIPDEALAIIEDFDSLHWYCQPCVVEVSKAINASQLTSLSTTQNPQIAIGQKIEALQSQLTGLMTKVNDHINARFQQLEEKLTTSSVPTASTTSIPSKTSQITETMATRVIDEYRDRETRKMNIIIHNAPESTATEPSVRIAHDTKSVADIAKSIDAGPVEIVNITRLGKKLDGRPRLMKV